MATASSTDLAGFEAQLATTKMFYTPAAAVEFTNSDALLITMKKVAEFSFAHGLLGEGASNANRVGVAGPKGIYGDSKNVKLRFDPSYMQMAANNKL
jgi:NitT/TauT family transport system substrate-binding protein